MHSVFSSIASYILTHVPVRVLRSLFSYLKKDRHTSTSEHLPQQILVDVSVIFFNDAGTGIQRTVKALLDQLLTHPPSGFEVCPVFATRQHGYRYAPKNFLALPQEIRQSTQSDSVKVRRGDIFLGLDLAAHLLYRHQVELLRWKIAGTHIHIVAYDLLPITHPEWFNAKTHKHFKRWIHTTAALADQIICISHAVKEEVDCWLQEKFYLLKSSIHTQVIALGADIESSFSNQETPEQPLKIFQNLGNAPTVIMVGTLEPRKGHAEVLGAFEQLWLQDKKIQLIFVGKPGWRTDKLQHEIREHREYEKRLWWIDNANDATLEKLYKKASGVLVASYAEGYGLPIIEALNYGKPVLVRDIPIFREVGGNAVSYFPNGHTSSLGDVIANWIQTVENNYTPPPLVLPTWHDSLLSLLKVIIHSPYEGEST